MTKFEESIIGLIREYGKLKKFEIDRINQLRHKMETAPKMRFTYWDDSEFTSTLKDKQDADFAQAIASGRTKLVFGMITNVNLATIRYMRFMQQIEDKYRRHPTDYLYNVYTDGGIEWKMDGWHP